MTKKEEECSSCDEQNKKVAGKITAEQLTTIKKQQEDITQLLKDVGFLETQKHGLLHKYAGVVQDAEEFKKELEKQYGGININLEDGSYTLIEEPKKSE
jgi:hypothetical protein|tara:strand:- start:839 stop:1135 length:297 start_codon:yes stop_codon:yes gene_type:complete